MDLTTLLQQQDMQSYNWKTVKMKSYDAFICLLPVETVISNKLLGTNTKVPAGKIIICEPYGNIRVLLPEELNNIGSRDTEHTERGQAFIAKHVKQYYVNDNTSLQSALPWTACKVYVDSTVERQAILVNPKKYSNIEVLTSIINAKYGQPILINKSGVQHGYGDYLLTVSLNAPGTIEVVNGKTFTELVDMRAFAGNNIQSDDTAYIKPEELARFRTPANAVTETTFKAKLDSLLKNYAVTVEANEYATRMLNSKLLVKPDNKAVYTDTDATTKLSKPVIIHLNGTKNKDNRIIIKLTTKEQLKKFAEGQVQNLSLKLGTEITPVMSSEYFSFKEYLETYFKV